MTLDPLGPLLITYRPNQVGALNWYNYCENNPLFYHDPTGECPGAVLGLAIGAVAGGLKEMAAQGFFTGEKSFKELDASKIAISAGIGAAKGFSVGLVADATAAAIITGGSGTPLILAAGAASGFITGYGTAFLGNLAEQKFLDEKDWDELDAREANRGCWVDGLIGAGGAVLSGVTALPVGAAKEAIATGVRLSPVTKVGRNSFRLITGHASLWFKTGFRLDIAGKTLPNIAGSVYNFVTSAPSILNENQNQQTETNIPNVGGAAGATSENPGLEKGHSFSHWDPNNRRKAAGEK